MWQIKLLISRLGIRHGLSRQHLIKTVNFQCDAGGSLPSQNGRDYFLKDLEVRKNI
jgi:hypothetical protein